MHDNIKELLMSDNREDVELGLIIARKSDVPAIELDEISNVLYNNDRIKWVNDKRSLFLKYLTPDRRRDIFTEWKIDKDE